MRLASIHQGGTVVPALPGGGDRVPALPRDPAAEGGHALKTPAGVGFARKPPVRLMEAGDTCEIEGIGRLVNTVEDERDGG